MYCIIHNTYTDAAHKQHINAVFNTVTSAYTHMKNLSKQIVRDTETESYVCVLNINDYTDDRFQGHIICYDDIIDDIPLTINIYRQYRSNETLARCDMRILKYSLRISQIPPCNTFNSDDKKIITPKPLDKSKNSLLSQLFSLYE